MRLYVLIFMLCLGGALVTPAAFAGSEDQSPQATDEASTKVVNCAYVVRAEPYGRPPKVYTYEKDVLHGPPVVDYVIAGYEPSGDLHLDIHPHFIQTMLLGADNLRLEQFPLTVYDFGDVELERVRSVADANTVVEVNDGTTARQIPMPAVHAYRGKIADDEHSWVFVSMVNGRLYGAVHHGDGQQYILAPDKSVGGYGAHRLMEAQVPLDQQLGANFVCGTQHPHHHADGIHAIKGKQDQLLDDDELLEIEVAVECDASVYEMMDQDLDRQIEYVSSMYAMISNIYETEVNITLYLKQLYIWTSATDADPYRDDDDIFAMLEEVRGYWRSERSNVSRDLVQMITVNRSGSVGGVAYPGTAGDGTVCDRSFGYSVIGIYGTFNYPTPAYTWDAVSAAHELGHNFSSPHSHSCFWGTPLDTCVVVNSGLDRNAQCVGTRAQRAEGSIMSYCHLLNGTVRVQFRDQVAGLIRVSVEKNKSDCVAAPRQPQINILAPLGDGTEFPLGQDLPISWTSHRVSTLRILYSVDLGVNWTEIATEVAASDRSFIWNVPTSIGAQADVIVRVEDINDATVFDQTWGTFGLKVPRITIQTPNGSETLVVGEPTELRWVRDAVTAVDVHVRAEGSSDWIEVDQNLDADATEWTPSEQWGGQSVRIRVSATGLTEKIQDISEQSYRVEIAGLVILEPQAGDELMIGTQFEIKWQAEFVDRVRIQYVDSTDTLILHPTLSALNGVFNWDIDAQRFKASDKAYIRLLGLRSGENLEVLAGPLKIVTNDPVLSVDPETLALERGFAIQSLAPNPATDVLSVRIDVRRALASLQIILVDLRGKRLLNHRVKRPGLGEIVHQINCAELAAGSYSLLVLSEFGQTEMPFIVRR